MRKFISYCIRFIPTLLLLWVFLSPLSVFGAPINYVPLQPIPGTPPGNSDFKTYLIAAFKIGISVAGVLSVLMLVIAGFQYATTDAFTGKEESKAKMTNVVAGLVLILVSYILLNTVNKDTVSLNLDFGAESVQIGGGFKSGLAEQRAREAIDVKIRAALQTYRDGLTQIGALETNINQINTRIAEIEAAGAAETSQEYIDLQNQRNSLTTQKNILEQQTEQGRAISAYQANYDQAMANLTKNTVTYDDYASAKDKMMKAYQSQRAFVDNLKNSNNLDSRREAEVLQARWNMQVDEYLKKKSAIEKAHPEFDVNRVPEPEYIMIY